MQRCHDLVVNSNRTPRRGIICLGMLRELLVMGLVLTPIMIALCDARTLMKWHLSPQESDRTDEDRTPILSLDLDLDRQILVIQTYPDSYEELAINQGQVLKRMRQGGLISVTTSPHNSTTVYCTQGSESQGLYFTISVLRDGQAIINEEFEGPNVSPADAHISDDGNTVILINHSGDGIGWSISETNPTRWEFQLPQTAVASCLEPNGRRLFAVSNEGEASICDIQTGQVVVSFETIPDCGRSISWSATGNRLAVADRNGLIIVYDTITGQEIWKRSIPLMNQRGIKLSSDGSRMAVAISDRRIQIWDFSHPEEQFSFLEGNSGFVMDCLFVSNNTKLIAGCVDGTIREWSLASNELLRQIR